MAKPARGNQPTSLHDVEDAISQAMAAIRRCTAFDPAEQKLLIAILRAIKVFTKDKCPMGGYYVKGGKRL